MLRILIVFLGLFPLATAHAGNVTKEIAAYNGVMCPVSAYWTVVLLRFSGELFAHSRSAISNWTGLW